MRAGGSNSAVIFSQYKYSLIIFVKSTIIMPFFLVKLSIDILTYIVYNSMCKFKYIIYIVIYDFRR